MGRPRRAKARLTIFAKDGDYDAFARALAEAHRQFSTRSLAYRFVPNHWQAGWVERTAA